MVHQLQLKGFQIIPLVFKHNNQIPQKDFEWDYISQKIDTKVIQNADVYIHLAGAPINKPWTKNYKSEIYNSRILGTSFLNKIITELEIKPKKFISASAIGIYPDPQIQPCAEDAEYGDTFLSRVCKDWENSALKIKNQGVEVSIVRTGLVFQPEDGLFPVINHGGKFKFYPTTGSPENVWSWIHVDDLVQIYVDLITDKLPTGIYNAVSPNPSSQKNAFKTLNHVSHSSSFYFSPNVPTWLLKILLGERSALANSNQTIIPQNLMNHGFNFKYPSIEEAFTNLIHGK